MNKNRGWWGISIALLMVIVALCSSGITIVILKANPSGGQGFGRLSQIEKIVEKEYYKDVTDDQLVTGAARGMLSGLGDPYTFYYTTDDMKQMQDHVQGKYAGVGLQLVVDPVDGLITVTRAFKDSPAAKAGIRTGDKIVEVLGESVTGKQLDDAVSSMKGAEGTEVNLVILRGDKRIPFTLTRQIVTVNRAEHRIIGNKIGYVALTEFLGDDVEGYMEAIEYFKQQQVRGMIIDLRGNPGGLVDDVVDIANTLCPEGLIVYTEDRYGNRVQEKSDAQCLGWPLVVLVDGGSASASEILAGAVQDHKVGYIVGTQTFGKGIVQTLHEFDDRSGMQLTTSRYFTPNGRSIHGEGITPDIIVYPDERVVAGEETLTDDNDIQLKRGLEALESKLGNQPMPTSEPVRTQDKDAA